ncbi:MAG TPA: outer membrane beta-barrel protein [Polyangiaceae bacterium]|jgi:hypothetical protein
MPFLLHTNFRSSAVARASFALALGLAFTALPRFAAAQTTVSDADRAAARELFVDGVKLQEAGNFADALDRFQRAQAVFSAPTHLLHIAECDAALGRLVESAETYRTLVRTPLPAGSPQAFVTAQQQGATELAQVEPRIPSIRLLVKPDRVARLTIHIDGQPMSAALVGVQRPTDPGTHTVVVTAPGYARNEQKVTLVEKETKDVSVSLQVGSGVTYLAPGTPYGQAQPGPYAAGSTTAYPPQTYPGTPMQGTVTTPPPPPPPYGVPLTERPPEEARGGFMLGVSTGYAFVGGDATSSIPLNQLASGGFDFGLEAGFRFVHRLYLGLDYEHGFLGGGSYNGTPTTSSAASNYIGLEFAYFSNPFGTSFFGEIGGGYRALDVSAASSLAAVTSSFSGAEVTLGIGMAFRLGPWVRLAPEFCLSAGQFSASNADNGGATHEFYLLRLNTFLDFARKH